MFTYVQLKMLRTLDEQTRRLIPNYDKFYDGIDTTRHHITLQDVLMPENEGKSLTKVAFLSSKHVLYTSK